MFIVISFDDANVGLIGNPPYIGSAADGSEG